MTALAAAATLPAGAQAVASFDFAAPAEMYMTSARGMRRQPVTYRRFSSAAEAVRFAIEELPAALLRGTVMEVGEERFEHLAIRALFDRPDYPLARHALPDVA